MTTDQRLARGNRRVSAEMSKWYLHQEDALARAKGNYNAVEELTRAVILALSKNAASSIWHLTAGSGGMEDDVTYAHVGKMARTRQRGAGYVYDGGTRERRKKMKKKNDAPHFCA